MKKRSIIERMQTFFQRWWLVHQLHKYIYYRGEVFDLRPYGNDLNMRMSTRDERVNSGVDRHLFLAWYTGQRFARFLNEGGSGDFVEKVIEDCKSKDWIESNNGRLNLGCKGREIYVAYYPIGAFIMFCEKSKFAWTLLAFLWLWLLATGFPLIGEGICSVEQIRPALELYCHS